MNSRIKGAAEFVAGSVVTVGVLLLLGRGGARMSTICLSAGAALSLLFIYPLLSRRYCLARWVKIALVLLVLSALTWAGLGFVYYDVGSENRAYAFSGPVHEIFGVTALACYWSSLYRANSGRTQASTAVVNKALFDRSSNQSLEPTADRRVT
jgi:hypothetical protein